MPNLVTMTLIEERSHKGEHLTIAGTVHVVLKDRSGKKRVITCPNIVTTTGNIYYAQKAVGATPTNVFNAVHMGSGATTPAVTDTATQFTNISGSGLAVDATFPAVNNTDTDNTGGGTAVVTWRFSYPQATVITGITEGIINVGTGAPAAGAAVLNHWRFPATFTKDATQTMVLYINHTVSGV